MATIRCENACCAMAVLLALFGIAMYPDMILSSPVVENSLNIYNAASSGKTHWIMLIVAILGMPPVLAYTSSIYYIFRGQVKLNASSY